MPVVRLIFVTVDADDVAAAERIWKEDCAPLMIKQPGCLSEMLLKAREHVGELISLSVWDGDDSLERYLASPDHEAIKQHSASLRAAGAPSVKLYEQV